MSVTDPTPEDLMQTAETPWSSPFCHKIQVVNEQCPSCHNVQDSDTGEWEKT